MMSRKIPFHWALVLFIVGWFVNTHPREFNIYTLCSNGMVLFFSPMPLQLFFSSRHSRLFPLFPESSWKIIRNVSLRLWCQSCFMLRSIYLQRHCAAAWATATARLAAVGLLKERCVRTVQHRHTFKTQQPLSWCLCFAFLLFGSGGLMENKIMLAAVGGQRCNVDLLRAPAKMWSPHWEFLNAC